MMSRMNVNPNTKTPGPQRAARELIVLNICLIENLIEHHESYSNQNVASSFITRCLGVPFT